MPSQFSDRPASIQIAPEDLVSADVALKRIGNYVNSRDMSDESFREYVRIALDLTGLKPMTAAQGGAHQMSDRHDCQR